MAYDTKQCADHAQVGPGVKTTTLSPRDSNFSGGLGTSGNTTSGSSQGSNRGKQGNG